MDEKDKKIIELQNQIDHLERELKQIAFFYMELLSDNLQEKLDRTIESLSGQRRDFKLSEFVLDELKKRQGG
jgi:hypothetical protein